MNYISVVVFIIFATCHTFANGARLGAPVALSESTAGKPQDAAPVNKPQSRVFPCPEAHDIAPCVCTIDEELQLTIDCTNITDNEELNSVFRRDFPVTTFHEFRMVNPLGDFNELQANCFGNVTFERIYMDGANISLVSQYALASSESRLNYIFINGGFLTEDTFPWGYLDEYIDLDTLSITYQHQLTWLPKMVSASMTYFGLFRGSVDTLTPGNYSRHCHESRSKSGLHYLLLSIFLLF